MKLSLNYSNFHTQYNAIFNFVLKPGNHLNIKTINLTILR